MPSSQLKNSKASPFATQESQYPLKQVKHAFQTAHSKLIVEGSSSAIIKLAVIIVSLTGADSA